MNLRRPRRKAKYYLVTDSEQVPRGKGEKNRCERSEIEPETASLQGVRAQDSFWVMACLLHNESASCRWKQPKRFWREGIVKASFKKRKFPAANPKRL